MKLVFTSLFTILCTTIAFTACAQNVEVVQSVPIETTLTVPGIRLTQPVWIEMIQSAKKTIDLEQYYINHKEGESLEPVINALKDAGARGVKIRFIIDSNFLKQNPDEAKPLNGIANLELKQISFANLRGIQHAKYMVVDQSNLFVGSANFDWLALSHIHEVGIHTIDSKMGADLEAVFNADWNSPQAATIKLDESQGIAATLVNKLTSLFGDKPGRGGTPTEYTILASPAVANPKGIPATIDSITAAINNAKTSVKVQVYQYALKDFSGTTWTVLDQAFRNAAARGVKVQFMVDNVAMKSGSTELKSLAQVPNMEVKTVIIPQWSGGPLAYARLVHSKYMMVDHSTSWVGTENWSMNYFTATRNVGIFIQNANTTTQLESIFDHLWNSEYATKL